MNDIEEILKATIQTKVIEAFNEAPEVIEKLVKAALSKDVNEHGVAPSYSDKKMPYMEWLVGEEIRRAVRSCIKEYVEGHKDSFQNQVKKAIDGGDFTTSLSKTIAEIMSQEYRWNVDLRIDKE